ncbi:hypothetical protein [Nocardioides sp. zg-1230]|uniref:hypothetical protein n=1 Tax=Nocardioides sp. zg-1230 TaxID=2736601 RepID=UPI001552BC8B|nr:hypothetical protein [Nocardioides sp. zg-1230]NPC43110.1 hypothetical protein [Nocardioides sp. zg-1230]
MSRITGVMVALATAAAVLTGSTVGASPPAPADVPGVDDLPREIEGGVELTLADGDLFRVWVGRGQRAVWSKRLDATTGVWSGRRVVLREKDLACGSVEARTSNGAVAVMAACSSARTYAEDQAPTGSHALWSADTVTWSSYELEGEAYDEPGISPDGSRAVWPELRGYVTWGPEGFTRHALRTPGREYTATATITDAAQVSYLYGADVAPRRCRLLVLTRTGDVAPARQEVSLDDACQDASFANVDSDTAWFGDFSDPGRVTVISRADAVSPWAVTAIAPAAAPGLDAADGRLSTRFFTAPGQGLYAVGSAGRRVVRAQAYDRASQTWGAPTIAYDAGRRRCAWGDNWWAEPPGVLMAALKCGGRHVVLTVRDGTPWQALRMGRHPYGLSPDGRYVAVPGRTRTHVISPERGVVTLPGGVGGRCDVVVPDGPEAAVLLTSAGRHRGWPTVLKASTADGWRTLSRTRLPTFPTDCLGARSSNFELPYRFDLFARWTGYTVRLVEDDGEWAVRRTRR